MEHWVARAKIYGLYHASAISLCPRYLEVARDIGWRWQRDMALACYTPYLFALATWYPAPLYVPYWARIIWSILANLIICGFSEVDCQENMLELRKVLDAHFLHNFIFAKSISHSRWGLTREIVNPDFKKHFPLHREKHCAQNSSPNLRFTILPWKNKNRVE